MNFAGIRDREKGRRMTNRADSIGLLRKLYSGAMHNHSLIIVSDPSGEGTNQMIMSKLKSEFQRNCKICSERKSVRVKINVSCCKIGGFVTLIIRLFKL